MSVVRPLLTLFSDVLVVIAFAFVFTGIRSGRIVTGGAPIQRASQPGLYWAIVSLYSGFGLLTVIVLTQGISQLFNWRAATGFLDGLFWNILLLFLPSGVSVQIYRAATTGTFSIRGGQIERARYPALFWTIMLMYGALGLLCLLIASGLLTLLLVRL